MPDGYREADTSKLIEDLEAKVTSLEKSRLAEFGKWIFRSVIVLIIVGLAAFWAFMWFRSCQESVRDERAQAKTAPARRRAADERICDGLEARYVGRFGDSLVCHQLGRNKILTIRNTYDSISGIRGVRIEETRP